MSLCHSSFMKNPNGTLINNYTVLHLSVMLTTVQKVRESPDLQDLSHCYWQAPRKVIQMLTLMNLI